MPRRQLPANYDDLIGNPRLPRWFERQRKHDEQVLGHKVWSLGTGHVRCERCGVETMYERGAGYGFVGRCGDPAHAPAWIVPRPQWEYEIIDGEAIERVPPGRAIDRFGVISGRQPGHPPRKD